MKLKANAKKGIVIGIVVLLLISLGIFSFIKIKEKQEYENSYEYKLTTIGYSEEEAKDLTKNLKNPELEYLLKQEKNDIYLAIIKEQYFIYDNFYQYVDYYQKNDEANSRDIIEKVNANVNEKYYENTTPTDISKNELMLVNKYHYLDASYTPTTLVTIPLDYAYGALGSQKVTEDTYEAFLNLWNASHQAGYYLMVNSSYRDLSEQQLTYDDYAKIYGTNYADSIAARPGYSEHQTGYSIDVFEIGTGQKDFANTDSYKWLKENAHKYGFIERYPEDKEDITGYAYESWHYRYVGIKAATYIYENKITFDEYYAYFVK